MIVFYIELRSGGAAHKALHSVGLSSVDAAQSLSGIFTAYGCFVFCCFYVFLFLCVWHHNRHNHHSHRAAYIGHHRSS